MKRLNTLRRVQALALFAAAWLSLAAYDLANIFYTDDEARVVYVDFAAVKEPVRQIRVSDAEGGLLLEEDVADLPLNTIYEVDMARLGEGRYSIELSTASELLIRKRVAITSSGLE